MNKARFLLGLALVAAAMGCSGPQRAAHPSIITAETVALQQGDVSGMQRCDGSGDIDVVLQDEKTRNPTAYDVNAPEWTLWKRQGATDAYFAAFGRTAADCAAVSGAGSGAATGGLVAGLVVKFKDAKIAAASYRGGATLFGLGPKDILFIQLTGGRVTTGSDTGLGPQSRVGSGTVAGSTYYFAFWQNKDFDADFMGYNVATTDADAAVRDINGRIH